MPPENVEIVRRIYDRYVTDPEALRDLHDSHYELDLTDASPEAAVIRGFDAAVEAVRGYIETFADYRFDIDEVIHADEKHVVIALHDVGRMRGGGPEVRTPRFHVWTFRNGKVVRTSSHLNRTRALEAAGLSE